MRRTAAYSRRTDYQGSTMFAPKVDKTQSSATVDVTNRLGRSPPIAHHGSPHEQQALLPQRNAGNQAMLRLRSRPQPPAPERQATATARPSNGTAWNVSRVATFQSRWRDASTRPNSDRSVWSNIVESKAERSIASVAGSGGQSLPFELRRRLEPAFGADFTSVRVHIDSAAAASAQRYGAHAWTRGEDIGFAAGRYAPHTSSGLRLLAHELAHVMQQRRSTGRSGRTDAAEQEADRAADAVGRNSIAHEIRAEPSSPVQFQIPLSMQQCTDIVGSGMVIVRTNNWFAYVERWWAANGSQLAPVPPGYVQNGTVYIFGSGRLPWAELPTVPQDLAELRRAEQAWMEMQEDFTSTANIVGLSRRQGPMQQVAQRANAFTDYERALQAARNPVPAGPGTAPAPVAPAAPAPVDPLAPTELQLPAAAPVPAAPPANAAAGAELVPAAPRAPSLGQRIRGWAAGAAETTGRGAAAAGRVARGGARLVGRGIRWLGLGLGLFGAAAEVNTVARAFPGVDPRDLPEGASFVDPGTYTGFTGREGTVHHRPDGLTEIHWPAQLAPLAPVPLPLPAATTLVEDPRSIA